MCVRARHVPQASLPADFAAIKNPHLRVDGARSPRARFPNANPELDIWPTGWVPDAQKWLPAKPPVSMPVFVGVVNKEIQSRNDVRLHRPRPRRGTSSPTATPACL